MIRTWYLEKKGFGKKTQLKEPKKRDFPNQNQTKNKQ